MAVIILIVIIVAAVGVYYYVSLTTSQTTITTIRSTSSSTSHTTSTTTQTSSSAITSTTTTSTTPFSLLNSTADLFGNFSQLKMSYATQNGSYYSSESVISFHVDGAFMINNTQTTSVDYVLNNTSTNAATTTTGTTSQSMSESVHYAKNWSIIMAIIQGQNVTGPSAQMASTMYSFIFLTLFSSQAIIENATCSLSFICRERATRPSVVSQCP